MITFEDIELTSTIGEPDSVPQDKKKVGNKSIIKNDDFDISIVNGMIDDN